MNALAAVHPESRKRAACDPVQLSDQYEIRSHGNNFLIGDA
jgi:hypothetical protein